MWCLQPVGIKGVLESEFWDVVGERCLGRAFRARGQQGVEDQLPPPTIVHPDAEEILCALHLVPVGAASGMAKIPLLGERKSQVEVCVCCCCTSSNLALSPGPLAGGPCVGPELGGCVGSDQPLEVEEQSSWTHVGCSAGFTLSWLPPRAPRRLLLHVVPVFHCRADPPACPVKSSFLSLVSLSCVFPAPSSRLSRFPGSKQLHSSFWSCAAGL